MLDHKILHKELLVEAVEDLMPLEHNIQNLVISLQEELEELEQVLLLQALQ